MNEEAGLADLVIDFYIKEAKIRQQEMRKPIFSFASDFREEKKKREGREAAKKAKNFLTYLLQAEVPKRRNFSLRGKECWG